MKTHSQKDAVPILIMLVLVLATTPAPVAGQDGYLALGGQNKTVELLQLSDLSKVATIDVAPIAFPALTFLPLRRRLYVYDHDLTGLNTVLDFGACSAGLLHPLSIPNPFFVGADGTESKVFVSSIAGSVDGHPSDGQNALYIVAPSTDTVTGLLGPSSTGDSGPRNIIFDPDRGELYVWRTDAGLNVYDQDLTLLRQCNIEGGFDAVAAGKIYSASSTSAEVFDAATCNHLRQVRLPGVTNAAVRTRAGDKVYVLTSISLFHQGDPSFLWESAVAVIDTATDQVSAFPLDREFYQGSLVLSADETRAYVAMWLFDASGGESQSGGGKLDVLDLQSGMVEEHPLDVTPSTFRGLAIIDKLGFQCGDGVIETACGEQCDPPGSVVNGSVCDVNCTLGCGNGIASGTEQCDDGNTNNNDACKNDCTWNVCGDGVINRGVEQCDDGAANGTGGDACSATCTLPPRTASGDVLAGGTLTTDVEGDGATAGAPVETWVTSPVAGPVIIEEGAPDPTMPSGYAFLGYSVHVTVASSTPDNPIQLVFEIHSSLMPPGSNQTAVEFSKNGVLVADCTAGGSSAAPDPCVASRELLGNGNLRVTIRSSSASFWGGVAPLHDARVYRPRAVSLVIPANKLLVTRKMAIRVRNADRLLLRQKSSTPIQLTATNIDCPLGLIADVPDFYPKKPFSQDTVTLAPRHNATARLRLVASRFAFPPGASPRHCTIRLSAAALAADNVDPTPANNTTTVQVTVNTR